MQHMDIQVIIALRAIIFGFSFLVIVLLYGRAGENAMGMVHKLPLPFPVPFSGKGTKFTKIHPTSTSMASMKQKPSSSAAVPRRWLCASGIMSWQMT